MGRDGVDLAVNTISSYIPLSVVPFRDTGAFGGVLEEVAKAIFLLLFALAGRNLLPNFLTGVVIGWTIGLGFEFLENASYFRSFFQMEEYTGLSIRILFGLFSGHFLFTGLVGGLFAVLLARFGQGAMWWTWPVALVPGVVLHMMINTSPYLFFMPFIGAAIIALLLTKGVRAHKARMAQV